jgi:hypothetical protein
MQPIETKLYAPFIAERKSINLKPGLNLSFEYQIDKVWERVGATVSKIRSSDGFPVKTFRQLVDEVAIVTINNRNYEMFYRGQTFDYKDSQGAYYKDKKSRTVIYPSICRPERKEDGTYKASIRKLHIQKRYDDIYQMIEMWSGRKYNQEELYLSLFQHYEILSTPLIDITQSLRVAATFALRKSDTGYVYVFGLPFPNGSISHFIDLGIVLIKLQNVCPVDAYRPRYQEGYLVGKYPIKPTKDGGDNLARRLVAKFRLDNSNGKFWDENFQPMPEDILFPKDDKFEKKMNDIKQRYINKNRS